MKLQKENEKVDKTIKKGEKSWPVIGQAKILLTNERSFTVASQPLQKLCGNKNQEICQLKTHNNCEINAAGYLGKSNSLYSI